MEELPNVEVARCAWLREAVAACSADSIADDGWWRGGGVMLRAQGRGMQCKFADHNHSCMLLSAPPHQKPQGLPCDV